MVSININRHYGYEMDFQVLHERQVHTQSGRRHNRQPVYCDASPQESAQPQASQNENNHVSGVDRNAGNARK